MSGMSGMSGMSSVYSGSGHLVVLVLAWCMGPAGAWGRLVHGVGWCMVRVVFKF